jgi:hypothetical protein
VRVCACIHRADIFKGCGSGAVATAREALQTVKTLHTVLLSKQTILQAVLITFHISWQTTPAKSEEIVV